MSGSILTNTSSMTALSTLRSISAQLEETEKHISTGLRIVEASDNIAYWGVSGTMRSDASVLSTVKDALHMGKGKLDQATKAAKQIKNEITQIKKDMSQIASAKTNDERIDEIKKDIAASLDNIKNAISNASMDGENLLASANTASGADDSFTFVSSFRRVGHNVVVDTIKLKKEDTRLFGVDGKGEPIDSFGKLKNLFDPKTFDFTGAGRDDAIKKASNTVEQALNDVSNVEISLGAVTRQVNNQVTFIDALTDNLTKSIGTLVDTDMDAQSARLSALQVQQQLAVQSLSLANQSTQHILALYKN